MPEWTSTEFSEALNRNILTAIIRIMCSKKDKNSLDNHYIRERSSRGSILNCVVFHLNKEGRAVEV